MYHWPWSQSVGFGGQGCATGPGPRVYDLGISGLGGAWVALAMCPLAHRSNTHAFGWRMEACLSE